jgi:hypothetical protein
VTAGRGRRRRSKTLQLRVVRQRAVARASAGFTISGSLQGELYPGMRKPLNLTLSNSNSFTLKVTKLTVSVRDATSAAGCSGTRNFRGIAAATTFSLPRGTYALSSLVADSSKWPAVEMLNLAENQDACKGAKLTFSYSGSATR